ncbi:DUF1918 domain-containing protein [Planctomonas psychrotolerans]|uniref:DUF1918 domain-containing protein n=1 Tax=Planctomonas psychrotolerans TaxID=2528712 RepID=UPI00123A29AD|nr:DUF1918 domain-containing protein [Planctomonas psychrotolerans]
MHAAIGDHLIIKTHHDDALPREGEIREVRGSDGGPPYVVRWQGDTRETLVFPGPDAVVQPAGRER